MHHTRATFIFACIILFFWMQDSMAKYQRTTLHIGHGINFSLIKKDMAFDIFYPKSGPATCFFLSQHFDKHNGMHLSFLETSNSINRQSIVDYFSTNFNLNISDIQAKGWLVDDIRFGPLRTLEFNTYKLDLIASLGFTFVRSASFNASAIQEGSQVSVYQAHNHIETLSLSFAARFYKTLWNFYGFSIYAEYLTLKPQPVYTQFTKTNFSNGKVSELPMEDFGLNKVKKMNNLSIHAGFVFFLYYK